MLNGWIMFKQRILFKTGQRRFVLTEGNVAEKPGTEIVGNHFGNMQFCGYFFYNKCVQQIW